MSVLGQIRLKLKKRRRSKFDQLRQRLILTPAEKRVAAFVLMAFVLGLGTKCYRDRHFATVTSQSSLDTARLRKEFQEKEPGAPTVTPWAKRARKSQPP
jgi:hypothetical protein